MRLTIIALDMAVYVDGLCLPGLPLVIPSNVSALQWAGDGGHIEFTDGTQNELISEIPQWALDAIGVYEENLPIEIPPTPAEIEATRIAALWQAAHDYEYAQVSGSAIGLLSIGVLQSLPKCLAVQAWIKSIWTLYYTRKAGTSTDTDYSSAGLIPHSVPELMVELGI